MYVQGIQDNFIEFESARSEFGNILTQHLALDSKRSSPQDIFFEAVRKGDVRAVEAILNDPPDGFDINAVDQEGRSALHLALLSPLAKALIPLLVEKGRIDLAILDKGGFSAFHVANTYALTLPMLPLPTGRARDYILHMMRKELMRSLDDRNRARSLQLIRAIHFKGEFEPVPGAAHGVTFLAYAAGAGDLDTVKAIVEAIKPSERVEFINRQGPGGNTALHAAAYSGHLGIYDYLKREGANHHILNADEHSPADLLPAGVERRDGPGRNKPGPIHNPLQIFYDVVRVLLGGTYDWEYGPFRDPPEELDDLSPTGTPEERAHQYAQRFNRALDRNPPVNFEWVRTWEERAELGNLVIHGGGAESAFMTARFDDLVTVASHATGRWALNIILDSGETVNFHYTTGENRTERNRQGGYDIYLTGRPGTRNNADQPWGSEDGMPTDVILVHELIHVARRISGQFDSYGTFTFGEGRDRIQILREEVYTVGLGPAALAEIGTENAYRRERGLALRDRYISHLELENGLWAGIEPDAPDAWWRAYRAKNAHSHGPTHSHGHGHTHKRDEASGHEMAQSSPQVYQDKLNSVVVMLAESIEDGWPAPLNKGNVAEAFKDMILYNLFHMGGDRGAHDFLKRAMQQAVDDIAGRIGNVFPEDPRRARAAVEAVTNYLKSDEGKGDAAYVAQHAWIEYRDVADGLPPHEANSFDSALNSLVLDYSRQIDLGARKLPHFEGSYAKRFKVLVSHFLGRNFYQFDPRQDREHWVSNAKNEALQLIYDRLPEIYGNPETGEWALDIFHGYIDRHGGDRHAEELAGEAFDEFVGQWNLP